MPCTPSNPLGCVGSVIGGLTGDAVSSAWNDVCKSFADAASSLLSAFAKAFVAIPSINVTGAGVKNVYAMSAALAAVVCALLLIGQVIRTAVTHDGSALARGLTGVGKATLACLVTLSVAATGLRASDELSSWIVTQSFGSQQALSAKIAGVFAWNPNLSGALLLVMAIVGILLVVILWFELLLRNAAVAILVATAPIAAAGQTSDSTRAWWPRLVSSTTQLIILKPIIALVFAVGFGLAGGSQNLESLLTGLLVLLLAVLAWPMVARFFAFASIQGGGGAGLAGLLGFAAGAAASRGSRAGRPWRVHPCARRIRRTRRRVLIGRRGSVLRWRSRVRRRLGRQGGRRGSGSGRRGSSGGRPGRHGGRRACHRAAGGQRAGRADGADGRTCRAAVRAVRTSGRLAAAGRVRHPARPVPPAVLCIQRARQFRASRRQSSVRHGPGG